MENKAKEVRICVLVITLFSPSQLERELSEANRSLSTIQQLQDTVRELQQVKTIYYNTLLLLPVTGGSRVSVEFKRGTKKSCKTCTVDMNSNQSPHYRQKRKQELMI